MAIKLQALRQLVDELRELPENESQERELSTREAVAVASEEITLLRQKGYSLEQIAKLLTDGGLKITEGTLKKYLSSTSKKPRRTAKIPSLGKATGKKAGAVAGKENGSQDGALAASKPEAKPVVMGQQIDPNLSDGNKQGVRTPAAAVSEQPGRFIPKTDSEQI